MRRRSSGSGTDRPEMEMASRKNSKIGKIFCSCPNFYLMSDIRVSQGFLTLILSTQNQCENLAVNIDTEAELVDGIRVN